MFFALIVLENSIQMTCLCMSYICIVYQRIMPLEINRIFLKNNIVFLCSFRKFSYLCNAGKRQKESSSPVASFEMMD